MAFIHVVCFTSMLTDRCGTLIRQTLPFVMFEIVIPPGVSISIFIPILLNSLEVWPNHYIALLSHLVPNSNLRNIPVSIWLFSYLETSNIYETVPLCFCICSASTQRHRETTYTWWIVTVNYCKVLLWILSTKWQENEFVIGYLIGCKLCLVSLY